MGGVGQRIKELRKASKLTQQELAEGVVTRSYISQIEKGLIQPSYDTLEKLARRLNVTVEEFFKEPENMALVVTDWKKFIRVAEGQAESGLYEQAQRTLDNSNIESNNELNDFDLGVLAWVRGKLAEVHGLHEEAERCYRDSLDHLHSYMYVKERVRSLDSLAYVYWRSDRNEEALETLNDAYSILLQHQIGGLHRISVLVNAGVVYARLGEWHAAMRFLQEADEVNQSLKTQFKTGHIFMTLGICYMRTKKFDAAEALYLRAIHYYEFTADPVNKAGSYANLGLLYIETERYAEAVEAIQNCLRLYEQQDNRPMIINALSGLAKTYFLQDEAPHAAAICRRILDLDSADSKYTGLAYEILGDIAKANADSASAIDQYLRAHDHLQKAREENNRVLRKIADLYTALGRYTDATRYFQLIASDEIKPTPVGHTADE